MKNNDLISVIIPTYNRGNVIKKSISSVLKQSYKNIELIIVDDGSTDNTEEIIKKIKDERIRYIKVDENKGACNARNVGINNAKGKYISFQDSDDIFDRYKLEKQVNNLKINGSDLDFCKIRVHEEIDVIIPDCDTDKTLNLDKINSKLCYGNLISTQSILVKTSIIKKCLFDINLPRLQDYDLVLRLTKKVKVSYTPEVLVDLYKYGDNISLNFDKLKKAVLLINEKNYGLNNNDSLNLRSTLLGWIIDENNKIYNKKIKELNNNSQLLVKENTELKEEINQLNASIDDYNVRNQILNDKIAIEIEQKNKILNSKGWKLIEKLRRIKKFFY